MKIIKSILIHWLEILIGALILIFVSDIRWFLLYFLIVVLLISRLLAEFQRKSMRIFRMESEVKLNSIIKKLDISEEEIQNARDEISDSLSEEDRKSLHQDLKDLGTSNPERFYRNPLDGLSDVERGKKFIDETLKKLEDS